MSDLITIDRKIFDGAMIDLEESCGCEHHALKRLRNAAGVSCACDHPESEEAEENKPLGLSEKIYAFVMCRIIGLHPMNDKQVCKYCGWYPIWGG